MFLGKKSVVFLVHRSYRKVKTFDIKLWKKNIYIYLILIIPTKNSDIDNKFLKKKKIIINSNNGKKYSVIDNEI